MSDSESDGNTSDFSEDEEEEPKMMVYGTSPDDDEVFGETLGNKNVDALTNLHSKNPLKYLGNYFAIRFCQGGRTGIFRFGLVSKPDRRE